MIVGGKPSCSGRQFVPPHIADHRPERGFDVSQPRPHRQVQQRVTGVDRRLVRSLPRLAAISWGSKAGRVPGVRRKATGSGPDPAYPGTSAGPGFHRAASFGRDFLSATTGAGASSQRSQCRPHRHALEEAATSDDRD